MVEIEDGAIFECVSFEILLIASVEEGLLIVDAFFVNQLIVFPGGGWVYVAEPVISAEYPNERCSEVWVSTLYNPPIEHVGPKANITPTW